MLLALPQKIVDGLDHLSGEKECPPFHQPRPAWPVGINSTGGKFRKRFKEANTIQRVLAFCGEG